jgi:hypothetical protein
VVFSYQRAFAMSVYKAPLLANSVIIASKLVYKISHCNDFLYEFLIANKHLVTVMTGFLLINGLLSECLQNLIISSLYLYDIKKNVLNVSWRHGFRTNDW